VSVSEIGSRKQLSFNLNWTVRLFKISKNLRVIRSSIAAALNLTKFTLIIAVNQAHFAVLIREIFEKTLIILSKFRPAHLTSMSSFESVVVNLNCLHCQCPKQHLK
jgi:hypothetical protein